MSSVSKDKRSKISECKTLEDVVKISLRKSGDLYASRTGTERDWKAIANGYQRRISKQLTIIKRLRKILDSNGIKYD